MGSNIVKKVNFRITIVLRGFIASFSLERNSVGRKLGLINLADTCFTNSIMQCLFYEINVKEMGFALELMKSRKCSPL